MRLTGDSRVALRWAETERFRGALCRRSDLVFAHLMGRYEFEFGDVVWRSKDLNGAEDTLSRVFDREAQFGALRDLGSVDRAVLVDSGGAWLGHLWGLCDPTVGLPESARGLLDLLATIREL